MKKNKILLFFAIFCVILFIFSLFFEINNVSLKEYWFSIASVLIGQYSFIYFLMYKLDSSLYYSFLNSSIGISSFFQSVNEYSFVFYYPVYLLCFAISSFAVFVLFRQKIHFKLFAILTLEAILLIAYKIKILNLWQLLLINGLYLIFVLAEIVFRIKRNLKEN